MAAVARRWCGFGLHGPGECAQEEEQGEADAVVCLAWPTTENIRENDSVAASSGARPWRPREGARGERRGEELGVGRRVRGVRAARHLYIASVGEVAVMRTGRATQHSALHGRHGAVQVLKSE